MNRPGWSNKSTALRVKAERSPVGPCSANGASNSRPEATARHALDLGVDLTKLPLSISNRSLGGRLVSLQSLHLPGGLVLHAGAVECARVALKAIGVGSLLAQPWQRSVSSSRRRFR